MTPRHALLLFTSGVAAQLAMSVDRSAAQPAPSFRASCAELRTKLDSLGARNADLVTIQVMDKLTLAKATDAVVYHGMCDLPAPRVLCVTYELDRLKPGDTVVLSGALSRPDANHVLLNPCLHHRPERPREN
jgi:hypothetical protein